ncbi:hypothetical protein Bcep1808_6907 (plasmid) [Burkholderia vietnamiensis G4]|uniref:Uncharacterized protein n=1 Tax=Burkholderia vietnamiensis (strain G4 / LMG 22486) TaxID=269482 RepID=A4JU41_BURVG|nr:hypothetical protein Bcep1808_6907 [Burkholderia vietnamiensis G4]
MASSAGSAIFRRAIAALRNIPSRLTFIPFRVAGRLDAATICSPSRVKSNDFSLISKHLFLFCDRYLIAQKSCPDSGRRLAHFTALLCVRPSSSTHSIIERS